MHFDPAHPARPEVIVAATSENTGVPGSGLLAHQGGTRHTVRPCGACKALVPADIGCEHWHPGAHTPKANDRRRARNARYQRAARERARQDVAAFKALMTPRPGPEIVPKL